MHTVWKRRNEEKRRQCVGRTSRILFISLERWRGKQLIAHTQQDLPPLHASRSRAFSGWRQQLAPAADTVHRDCSCNGCLSRRLQRRRSPHRFSWPLRSEPLSSPPSSPPASFLSHTLPLPTLPLSLLVLELIPTTTRAGHVLLLFRRPRRPWGSHLLRPSSKRRRIHWYSVVHRGARRHAHADCIWATRWLSPGKLSPKSK